MTMCVSMLSVCGCLCRGVHAEVKGQAETLVLSFHFYEGSGDQTGVAWGEQQAFYLLHCLTNPSLKVFLRQAVFSLQVAVRLLSCHVDSDSDSQPLI